MHHKLVSAIRIYFLTWFHLQFFMAIHVIHKWMRYETSSRFFKSFNFLPRWEITENSIWLNSFFNCAEFSNIVCRSLCCGSYFWQIYILSNTRTIFLRFWNLCYYSWRTYNCFWNLKSLFPSIHFSEKLPFTKKSSKHVSKTSISQLSFFHMKQCYAITQNSFLKTRCFTNLNLYHFLD